LFDTGAGISTESGIPDYRSADVGLYARSKNRPVIYQQFINDPAIRVRYWARNFLGWPRFSSTLPNYTHTFFKKMEDKKKLYTLLHKMLITCIQKQEIQMFLNCMELRMLYTV